MIDIRILDTPVQFVPIEPYPQPSGAECVFLGRTRIETHPEHGQLVKLSYEAYRPMAEGVLRKLAEDAARQYECLVVRIHHAIGEVPPGEASVMIQVVTGHRAASFEACHSLIDRLKEEVPIWKQEIWADGTSWSEGHRVNSKDSSS